MLAAATAVVVIVVIAAAAAVAANTYHQILTLLAALIAQCKFYNSIYFTRTTMYDTYIVIVCAFSVTSGRLRRVRSWCTQPV